MKAYQVSLINALTLIALGVWGYFASESPSPTAFIPAGLGVILLVLNGGLRPHLLQHIIAHFCLPFFAKITYSRPRPRADYPHPGLVKTPDYPSASPRLTTLSKNESQIQRAHRPRHDAPVFFRLTLVSGSYTYIHGCPKLITRWLSKQKRL
jgi:hypothetical protein